MPTHAVSENADSLAVHLLEVVEDGLRELGRNVAIHLIAFRPRGLCGVEVKACAGTEIVRVILAFNLEATCRSKCISGQRALLKQKERKKGSPPIARTLKSVQLVTASTATAGGRPTRTGIRV